MIMSSIPSGWTRPETMEEMNGGGLLTHALAANDIRKPTKDELAEQVSDWGSSFDASGLPS